MSRFKVDVDLRLFCTGTVVVEAENEAEAEAEALKVLEQTLDGVSLHHATKVNGVDILIVGSEFDDGRDVFDVESVDDPA